MPGFCAPEVVTSAVGTSPDTPEVSLGSGALAAAAPPRVAVPETEREPSRDLSSPLRADEIREFEERGFLAIGRLCSPGELLWIRATLLDLLERQTGRDEGNQFDMLGPDLKPTGAIQPQIIKPGVYAPDLLRTKYFRGIQAIARQLLGPETQFSFDHCILKPAGSATATPWHQDEAHQDDPNFQYKQISFWMPLQEATIDNGCMRYVPGSNQGALLPHRDFRNDPRIHAIECPGEHFDESAAATLPVPAGCCILHDGRTLHSALPNRSRHARLAYVLAFTGPPVPRTEPLRYTWNAGKRTAALDRSLGWRRHGGSVVLMLRWLRGFLSDPRKIRIKLRKLRFLIHRNWSRRRD